MPVPHQEEWNAPRCRGEGYRGGNLPAGSRIAGSVCNLNKLSLTRLSTLVCGGGCHGGGGICTCGSNWGALPRLTEEL